VVDRLVRVIVLVRSQDVNRLIKGVASGRPVGQGYCFGLLQESGMEVPGSSWPDGVSAGGGISTGGGMSMGSSVVAALGASGAPTVMGQCGAVSYGGDAGVGDGRGESCRELTWSGDAVFAGAVLLPSIAPPAPIPMLPAADPRAHGPPSNCASSDARAAVFSSSMSGRTCAGHDDTRGGGGGGGMMEEHLLRAHPGADCVAAAAAAAAGAGTAAVEKKARIEKKLDALASIEAHVDASCAELAATLKRVMADVVHHPRSDPSCSEQEAQERRLPHLPLGTPVDSARLAAERDPHVHYTYYQSQTALIRQELQRTFADMNHRLEQDIRLYRCRLCNNRRKTWTGPVNFAAAAPSPLLLAHARAPAILTTTTSPTSPVPSQCLPHVAAQMPPASLSAASESLVGPSSSDSSSSSSSALSNGGAASSSRQGGGDQRGVFPSGARLVLDGGGSVERTFVSRVAAAAATFGSRPRAESASAQQYPWLRSLLDPRAPTTHHAIASFRTAPDVSVATGAQPTAAPPRSTTIGARPRSNRSTDRGEGAKSKTGKKPKVISPQNAPLTQTNAMDNDERLTDPRARKRRRLSARPNSGRPLNSERINA
jgi:hypothetical protein